MTTDPNSVSSTSRRWLQLLSACLTALLICFTGPAVVLPSISQALGGTPVELNWVLNGYILAYGSVIMVAGSLVDLIGPRRVWLLGLALFCAATFLLPLAPSVFWMDVLRLVQGTGGAAAFAAAMSSLAPLFHGAARARAFSLLGTTFGIGLSFGPPASGWLVEAAGWHWVFLATGLVGLLGAGGGRRARGARRHARPARLARRAVLHRRAGPVHLRHAAGARNRLAQSRRTGLAAGICRAGRGLRARRAPHRQPAAGAGPVPKRPLRRRAGAGRLARLFIALIAMLPGRLIGMDGYGALAAGQLMIGLAAPLLVVPFLAALLTRWFSHGLLSAAGLLAGGGLLMLDDALAQGGGLLLPMGLIGAGIGLPWGLMDALAVSVVDKDKVGMATGIFNTVRVSADGVAIAVLSALLAFLIQARLGAALPADPALALAANRAALGQLAEASALLPGAADLLRQSYGQAFGIVLRVLAAIAALTAVLIYALLGRREGALAGGRVTA